MVAYEFYLNDYEGKINLVGILPERRKNPNRIAGGSIVKWGRMFLSDSIEGEKIFFELLIIDDILDKIEWIKPPLKSN